MTLIRVGYERTLCPRQYESERASLHIEEDMLAVDIPLDILIRDRQEMCRRLVLDFLKGKIDEAEFKQAGGTVEKKQPDTFLGTVTNIDPPKTPRPIVPAHEQRPPTDADFKECPQCRKKLRGYPSKFDSPKGSGNYPMRWYCTTCKMEAK